MKEQMANAKLHQSLRELSILIDAADRRILSKYRLRSARFYAMESLHHRPGLTLGELSDQILIGRASASRMVFSMEKDGLVAREPDPNDRRLFT
ncbi:MAG: MarR family transcriptional regulator, partial [Chloroflexota bacterium]